MAGLAQSVSMREIEQVKDGAKKIVHKGIVCAECGERDFGGIRYNSAIFDDYDICEICEAKTAHPYLFFSIRDSSVWDGHKAIVH